MEPPPDRLVNGVEAGLVVARDQELELRLELEEVLAHEAGFDALAACEGLDPAFGPAPALLGLARGDEPRAAQAGELGRVPVAGTRP